jgi:PadR family transcriptional regulator PadR
MGYDIHVSPPIAETAMEEPDTSGGPPAVGADAADSETCDLNDCSCTGKNIGKFTSPAALLAIAEAGCLSGYDIAERLRSMPLGGETGPDTGGLYRTLRRMERFNLVTSMWDTEGGGPARRLYTLTNLGDLCLDRWKETLKAHRDAIDGYLADYERCRAAEQLTDTETALKGG